MTDQPENSPENLLTAPADRAEPTLRERLAAALYEQNVRDHWANAHPDDVLAYGSDADTTLALLAATAFRKPAKDEPETEEQRAHREETERAHAAGDHEYCGAMCEVEFPSDMLRNAVLYAALPGSARMLDELLRRAAGEAGHDAERYKADHLAACKTIAEMHAAATGRTGMGPIRGVVEDIADMRTHADDAEAELSKIRAGLHVYRYGLDRGVGRDISAEYWRDLLNHALTGPVEPCDRDEQYARADQAEAAIKRTVDAMRAYVVASGGAGVNPKQVIDLLSSTWPNGNHEAPAPAAAEEPEAAEVTT